MGSLIVAVLGAQNYGNCLGKKGTSTDITIYNLKRNGDIVTFVEPSRYPERLAPLFYTVSMARKAVVIVDELNSTLGECIVMLQCSGIDGGYIVLRNYLTRERIEPLIKGTILERFNFVEDNPVALREHLSKWQATQMKSTPMSEEGAGTLSTTHVQGVKGVGAVVLGVVIRGKVEKHMTMRVIPGDKAAQIRSIQKEDDDFDVTI